MVMGRVIPGGGRVLFGDRLVVEMSPISRREKSDSEKQGHGDGKRGEGEVFRYLSKGYTLGRIAASTR